MANNSKLGDLDRVDSVRIVPTSKQKRFINVGAILTISIAAATALAAILSIPALQPYLSGTSPNARATPAKRDASETVSEVLVNKAAAGESPPGRASPPALGKPTIALPQPDRDLSPQLASQTATPVRPVVSSLRGLQMSSTPADAPIGVMLAGAFVDGGRGSKIVAMVRATAGDVRAYAPMLNKGRIQNWSLTDLQSGASCHTYAGWIKGLPGRNPAFNQPLEAESVIVGANGLTFTAGFDCDGNVKAGDDIVISAEVITIAPEGKIISSSFSINTNLSESH